MEGEHTEEGRRRSSSGVLCYSSRRCSGARRRCGRGRSEGVFSSTTKARGGAAVGSPGFRRVAVAVVVVMVGLDPYGLPLTVLPEDSSTETDRTIRVGSDAEAQRQQTREGAPRSEGVLAGVWLVGWLVGGRPRPQAW